MSLLQSRFLIGKFGAEQYGGLNWRYKAQVELAKQGRIDDKRVELARVPGLSDFTKTIREERIRPLVNRFFVRKLANVLSTSEEATLERLRDGGESPENFFSLIGFRQDLCFNWTLEDILLNHLQHGNKSDLRKGIIVNLTIHDEDQFAVSEVGRGRVLFEFEFEDEGPGFDVSAIPDEIDENELDNTGGRGIPVLREMAHKVEFWDPAEKRTGQPGRMGAGTRILIDMTPKSERIEQLREHLHSAQA